MVETPDVELLKQFISYDKDTGLFTRHTRCNADNESVLGPLTNTDTGGYVIFSVLNESYLAHRLAFSFMGYEIPDIVDHKNRIRNDNRWANLRPSDKFINAQNKSTQCNNVSGHPGVIFDRVRLKFRTYVRINGASYTAGRFKDFDEAVEAIENLKREIQGDTYVSRNP